MSYVFLWLVLLPASVTPTTQDFANISSVFLEERHAPQCFCWSRVKKYGSNRHPKNPVILRGRKKKHYAFYISFNIQNILGYTGVFGLKANIRTEQKVSFLQCPRHPQSGGSLKSTSPPSIFCEFPTPSCPLLLLAGGHCLNLGELHPPAVNDVRNAKSSPAPRAGKGETVLCHRWFSVLLAEVPKLRVIKK